MVNLIITIVVICFFVCAYYGIVGTNEAIEYNNRKVKKNDSTITN